MNRFPDWFRFRYLAMVITITTLLGIGIYAAVYQFNDGKISNIEYGMMFLGMALPNFFMAGILRMFRVHVGKIFIGIAICCLITGLLIITL